MGFGRMGVVGMVGAAVLVSAAVTGPAEGAVFCRKKSGVVTSRDVCKAKETQLNLADFGALGPVGPQGPAGAPGAPATALWAVVNSDGTLARGSSHVVSAQALGVGFEVIFDRDVSTCAYLASQGDPGDFSSGDPGEIAVVGRQFNANGVYINTFDSTGASVDRSYMLAVFCD